MEKQKISYVNENKSMAKKEEIDMSKTPFQRILTYLLRVDSPCSFDMEGYRVELEWANTDITLQELVEEIFAS